MLTAKSNWKEGTNLALVSVIGSATLAILNLAAGLWSGSTSVAAAGVEFAGDVFTSAVVYLGLHLAARPADHNHPYGHGRVEMLAGLLVGLVLVAGGAGICVRSLRNVGDVHPPPGLAGLWTLAASVVVKGVLSAVKFRAGRRLGSAALVADAWNDAVDILSGLTAMSALALTLYSPDRFLAADHYGGFAVGLIVAFTGLNVARDASLQLMDTMPSPRHMDEIRRAARQVPGVRDVEKCFARKTGWRYHVDLHLEVDPEVTVRTSHEIATAVRIHVVHSVPWVADVLVHVEPYLGNHNHS